MGIFGGIFGGGGSGAGLGSAPTITVVSPDPDLDPGDVGAFPADLATAQQTEIVLDIDGTDGVAYACVSCRYPAAPNGNEILVYAAGAFRGEFAARSWAETIGTTLRLHCLPAGGWPDSGDIDDINFDVDALGGGDGSLTTTRTP